MAAKKKKTKRRFRYGITGFVTTISREHDGLRSKCSIDFMGGIGPEGLEQHAIVEGFPVPENVLRQLQPGSNITISVSVSAA